MSHMRLMLPMLAAGMLILPAQAQNAKIGIINIQNAIIGTKEGQKAAQDLEQKVAPRRKTLEGRQGEIAGLRDQLQKGSNTMSQDQRDRLTRDIDTKTKSFNRELEDANAEAESEQQRLLQDLGQKMFAVIDKYARDNGYTLVLDVSSPQTPVIFAANQTDITKEVVDLYDRNAGTAPAGGVAPRPATPTSATPSAVRPMTPTATTPGTARPSVTAPATTAPTTAPATRKPGTR